MKKTIPLLAAQVLMVVMSVLYAGMAFADGELDPGFGWIPEMKVVPIQPGTNTIEKPNAMACFADGTIVVAGSLYISPANINYCSTVICVDSNADIVTSFGSNGVVILDFDLTGGAWNMNSPHYAATVGIQNFGNGDERVVISGIEFQTDQGFGSLFALRLNKDGSLDDGGPDDSTPNDHFGTNGIYIYDENPAVDDSNHHVYDLAIDTNNIIAIAGDNNDKATIVMLNTNGVPLASFGSNGVATVSFAATNVNTSDTFYDVCFAANGDLLLAGGDTGNSKPFAVVRMDRSGVLVPGFGSNGIAWISNTVGTAHELALDGNNLYVAGNSDLSENVVFSKLDVTTGIINTNFGINGLAEITPGTKGIQIRDMSSDGHGGFVTCGLYNFLDNNRRFCFMRITTNGVDTAYGIDGSVVIVGTTLLSSSFNGIPLAMLPEPDGRFFVTGADDFNTENQLYPDFSFMRITTNGFIDRSIVQFFPATNHILAMNIPPPSCVDIDDEGRILLGGSDGIPVYSWFVSRYLSDGRPDITFAMDDHADGFNDFGKRALTQNTFFSTNVISKRIFDVYSSSNGSIYACGSYFAMPDTGDNAGYSFVCKLTEDGLLDTTFGTNDSDGVDGFLSIQISDPGIPQGAEALSHLIELDDGRIVAAGYGFFPWNTNMYNPAVITFDQNGVLDTTFSSNGVYRFPYTPNNDSSAPRSLMRDMQGRLLISCDGAITSNTMSGVVIFRLMPDGTLDTTFGNSDEDGIDGVTYYNPGISAIHAPNASATLQRHGSELRIVAGYYKQWISRFNSDSTQDTSFVCGAGEEKLSAAVNAVRVAVMPDGRLIAVNIPDSDSSCRVIRLSRNGEPDPLFGTNTIPFVINDIAIDPASGDVIVAGGHSDFHLTRIQNSIQPTLSATFGKGITFDGADDYIFFNTSNAPSFSGSNDYTVSFWVNPSSYGVPYRLESAATDSYRDSIRINSARQIAFRITRNGFGYDTLTTSDTISWNEWSYITCVKDGAKIRIYINGQWSKGKFFTAGIQAATPSDGGLYLGKRGIANDSHFPGTIDNLYVADIALNVDQIRAWMYRDMNTSCNFYSNIVLSLNFDVPGTNLLSCAGARRVGTLYNMDISAFTDTSDLLCSWKTWAGNTLNGALLANDTQGSSSNGLDWNLNFQIVSNSPLGTVTIGDGNAFTFVPTLYTAGTNSFSYQFVDVDGKTSAVKKVDIVIPADWDNDGISDYWEAEHGLSPTNSADATANPDSDPFNNTEEYIADTDPNNSNDWFHITAVSNASASSAQATVYFKSSGNRLYTLLGCNNLLDAIWTNVTGCGPTTGIGGTDSMSDTNVPGKGPFYRMKVKLP